MQLVTFEDLSNIDPISTEKLWKKIRVFRSSKPLKSLGSAVLVVSWM